MFFKKKATPKALEPTFVLAVPFTEHFKGFKRIPLDVYGDPEVDKGLAAYRAADKIEHIIFKEYQYPNVSPLIRVYADNYKLGTIWSTSRPEQYEMIKQGRCVKATVGYNDLDNVFLFVKFK